MLCLRTAVVVHRIDPALQARIKRFTHALGRRTLSIILVTPPEISQADLLKTPLDLARELHAKEEASVARAKVLEALTDVKQ